MSSDKRNSAMARDIGLLFCCLTLLQPEKHFLGHCCSYNTFFMDLLVLSFVSHLSLLTRKSVDFVVGT